MVLSATRAPWLLADADSAGCHCSTKDKLLQSPIQLPVQTWWLMCRHGICCEVRALTNEMKALCYCKTWIRPLTPLLLLWLLAHWEGNHGGNFLHTILVDRLFSSLSHEIPFRCFGFNESQKSKEDLTTTARFSPALYWKPRKAIYHSRFAEVFVNWALPNQNRISRETQARVSFHLLLVLWKLFCTNIHFK